MIGFLVHKLVYSFGVLLVVATAVFVLLHLGGDPTAGFTPPGASAEQRAVIRDRFGLDRPLRSSTRPTSATLVQGDFGESWRARRPAMDAVLAIGCRRRWP